MHRAVLDANVIISAFIHPEGVPGRLLVRLIRDNAFELVLSREILEETRRALGYEQVRKRISLSDHELDIRLTMLEVLSDPVEVAEVAKVSRDPGDDIYIATAKEGRAGFIVTGDDDLLSLKDYEGIRLVTPRTFLELL